MNSIIFFGKRRGFEYFHDIERNPHLGDDLSLSSILELDDYHIKIEPNNLIYGVQFVEVKSEGEDDKNKTAIFVFLTVYKHSLDAMGRRGYHAFSLYFPFQNFDGTLTRYLPLNIEETLMYGLNLSERLKDGEFLDVYGSLNVVLIKYVLHDSLGKLKLEEGNRLYEGKKINDFFIDVIFNSDKFRYTKYYGGEKGLKASDYPSVELKNRRVEDNPNTKIELAQVWRDFQKSKETYETSQDESRHQQKLETTPYYIIEGKFSETDKKIFIPQENNLRTHSIPFDNNISEELIKNELQKLLNHKGHRGRDLMIHLCRTNGLKELNKHLNLQPTDECTLMTFGYHHVKSPVLITIPLHKPIGHKEDRFVILPDFKNIIPKLKEISKNAERHQKSKSTPDLLEDIEEFTFNYYSRKKKPSSQKKLERLHSKVVEVKNIEDLHKILLYYFASNHKKPISISYNEQHSPIGDMTLENLSKFEKLTYKYEGKISNLSFYDYIKRDSRNIIHEPVRITKPTGRDHNSQKKQERDSIPSDKITKTKKDIVKGIFKVLRFMAIPVLIFSFFFFIKSYYEGRSNLPDIPKQSEIPIFETPSKEEIKKLSLTPAQRKSINDAIDYLSKINKYKKRDMRLPENESILFPSGKNRVKSYKTSELQFHINSISPIISELSASSINQTNKRQVKKISDALVAHKNNYYPVGFKKSEYRIVVITEVEANSYGSVFDLAQAKSVPWKLLVEFNRNNIEILDTYDNNGNPNVQLNWETPNRHYDNETLIVYVPK